MAFVKQRNLGWAATSRGVSGGGDCEEGPSHAFDLAAMKSLAPVR